MKQTPLKRTTGLKADPAKTREWVNEQRKHNTLAPIAKKAVKGKRLYRDARADYLADNPICKWPGCQCPATEIHHAKGRIGPLLWNPEWFRGLCSAHHRHAHAEPLEAKSAGVSLSRLEVG